MQIFALFRSSSTLDLAILDIRKKGIDSHDIFVVPMKEQDDLERAPDKRYPEGRDSVDKGFAFATGFSVITAGVGFELTLGPIIWGIIGAFAGFLFGLLISSIQLKKRGKKLFRKSAELPIILIVNCEEHIIRIIEEILYDKGALGVNTPLRKGSGAVLD